MLLRLKHSWLVWSLLLCLVLINGFMAAPSVDHAQHHADHKAGTHSTGICAWQCAGGVGIESAAVPVTSELQLVECVTLTSSDTVLSVCALSQFLRGPPPIV